MSIDKPVQLGGQAEKHPDQAESKEAREASMEHLRLLMGRVKAHQPLVDEILARFEAQRASDLAEFRAFQEWIDEYIRQINSLGTKVEFLCYKYGLKGGRLLKKRVRCFTDEDASDYVNPSTDDLIIMRGLQQDLLSLHDMAVQKQKDVLSSGLAERLESRGEIESYNFLKRAIFSRARYEF